MSAALSPEPKKIKCRVALVVSDEGMWNACGWSLRLGSKIDPGAFMDSAIEGIESGVMLQKYWIEVEVEVPQEKTIDGGTVLHAAT